jgi:biotin transport system permease protein
VAVLLLAFNAWQNGWPHAVEVVGDLLALILAATVLTATTAVNDLLDTIVRALGPFRRFGVDPERVGLAFSLALRALPGTLDLAAETRDAARARGLERSLRARTTPLVLRVVARARDTGEAMHARGIAD